MTRNEAIREIKRLGYTIQFDTGSCGDYGLGSRLYFKKPNAQHNKYGQPLPGYHATISKMGPGRWVISEF